MKRTYLPRKIELSNCPAYIFYRKRTTKGLYKSDKGVKGETHFINGDSKIILNGDFRAEILKLINGVRFPYLMVSEWFTMMEKEWGSSWSANSSTNNWLNSR